MSHRAPVCPNQNNSATSLTPQLPPGGCRGPQEGTCPNGSCYMASISREWIQMPRRENLTGLPDLILASHRSVAFGRIVTIHSSARGFGCVHGGFGIPSRPHSRPMTAASRVSHRRDPVEPGGGQTAQPEKSWQGGGVAGARKSYQTHPSAG